MVYIDRVFLIMRYGIYWPSVFNATLNISFNSESKSLAVVVVILW